MRKISENDYIEIAKKYIGKIPNEFGCVTWSEVTDMMEAEMRKLTAPVTGKATVKADSKFRYKGLELDIIALHNVYDGFNSVYPDGTREFRLSLKGTQWENEQTFTVMTELELENIILD